jgi:hypothetical protein
MGLALLPALTVPRFQLCACLVSPALQPTFIPWQRRWRPTLPKPRLVLAVDCGHGQSQYDRNPDNYTLPVALADLSAGADPAADGHRRCHPQRYRSVIEPHGLVRLKGYIGKLPTATSRRPLRRHPQSRVDRTIVCLGGANHPRRVGLSDPGPAALSRAHYRLDKSPGTPLIWDVSKMPLPPERSRDS